MDTIFKITTTVLLAIGIILIGYFANSFLVLEKQKAENQAHYECAATNRYEVVTEDTTISYPPKDLYENCLKEKGL